MFSVAGCRTAEPLSAANTDQEISVATEGAYIHKLQARPLLIMLMGIRQKHPGTGSDLDLNLALLLLEPRTPTTPIAPTKNHIDSMNLTGDEPQERISDTINDGPPCSGADDDSESLLSLSSVEPSEADSAPEGTYYQVDPAEADNLLEGTDHYHAGGQYIATAEHSQAIGKRNHWLRSLHASSNAFDHVLTRYLPFPWREPSISMDMMRVRWTCVRHV